MEVTDIVNLFSRKTSILKNISKDCTILIFQFAYNYCTICNKCVYGNNKCKECNKYYCGFDFMINTSRLGICPECNNNRMSFREIMYKRYIYNCLIVKCGKPAIYGYRNILCYCKKHSKGKKLINYSLYCTINNCPLIATHINNDLTTVEVCNMHATDKKSFLYNDYESKNSKYTCTRCNKSCNVVYSCLCPSSALCMHCVYLETWYVKDCYSTVLLVCGKCYLTARSMIEITMESCYRPEFSCDDCDEDFEYVYTWSKPYKFKCKEHCTMLCDAITNKCAFSDYCLARGYMKSTSYCAYHHSLLYSTSSGKKMI